MEEINRFVQKPEDKDCPRYQTRQYIHDQYGLLQVSVNECDHDDEEGLEQTFTERLERLLEELETMNDTGMDITVTTEDGDEITL